MTGKKKMVRTNVVELGWVSIVSTTASQEDLAQQKWWTKTVVKNITTTRLGEGELVVFSLYTWSQRVKVVGHCIQSRVRHDWKYRDRSFIKGCSPGKPNTSNEMAFSNWTQNICPLTNGVGDGYVYRMALGLIFQPASLWCGESRKNNKYYRGHFNYIVSSTAFDIDLWEICAISSLKRQH